MDRLWADGPPTRTYTPTPLRDERPAEPRATTTAAACRRGAPTALGRVRRRRAPVEAGRAGWRRSGVAPSPPRS